MAVIGPALAILGTVISTIGTIVGAIGGVIGILGAPFLGPLMIAAGAIAAIIAIGVALYQNWDYIKAKAQEFVENVKQKWEDFKANTVQKFTDLKDGAKEKIDNLHDGVVEKVHDLKEGAEEKIRTMKEFFDEKFGGIADKAQEIFEKVKGFIEDPVGSAKDFVKGAIEDIKGFFDFEWHLPELKLPHINVGSYIDVPVLGTIPDPRTLTVDWYDKAMDIPRILKDATIFGAKRRQAPRRRRIRRRGRIRKGYAPGTDPESGRRSHAEHAGGLSDTGRRRYTAGAAGNDAGRTGGRRFHPQLQIRRCKYHRIRRGGAGCK